MAQRLLALLSAEAEAPDRRPDTSPERLRHHPLADEAVAPERFREALQQILATARPLVETGRAHFVGLGPLRESMGQNWERFADLIGRVAARVIGRHLAPGDIFTRSDDENWLIIFPTLNGDAGRLKCALIAKPRPPFRFGLADLYRGVVPSHEPVRP